MKASKFLLFFIYIGIGCGVFAQDKESLFYVIPLKQEVNNASYRSIKKGLEESIDKKADYCILDINTYGGAVDAADNIRNLILHHSIPVIAFINNQAASAGALISIACDSIYMKSGGSMGAATVVNSQGEVMPDKYQSFMRAMMRSTAEGHGKVIIYQDGKQKEVWRRDPLIAQAMVSKDSVLSFTPLEAIDNRYCEGMAESIKDVIVAVNGGNDYGYIIEEQKFTFLDKIILFFLNPVVQSVLLMMIIGGIYFEMQSPGIGLPLIIAITGGVLYFVPLYLEGMVQNWELIVFSVGILLLLLEIFVIPGFGVSGIMGIICIITGLTFAMIDNDTLFTTDGDYNFKPLLQPLAIVLVSLLMAIVIGVWLASRLLQQKRLSRVVLHTTLGVDNGFVGVNKTSLDSLKGLEGIVATDLKPIGTINIDGKHYQAKINYGFASKGEKVFVVETKENYLLVSL